MGRAWVLALALALTPGLSRRAGTAQMQCERCEGLSQEACVAAINGALYGLQDDQRLALLEHVFAGDVCDELPTETCLSTLDSVLHSVSEDQRGSIYSQICADDLLAEYSMGQEKSKVTCTICSGLGDDACLSSIDGMLGSLDCDAGLPVLKSLFDSHVADARCAGLDDEHCLAALRDSLASISDASRLVVYKSACSQDQQRFQHMTVPQEESTSPLVSSCDICDGLTEGKCLETVKEAVNGFTQLERLIMLELMYPGDSCEDKSNSECLQHLDRMFSSEPDDSKMERLDVVCTSDLIHLQEPPAMANGLGSDGSEDEVSCEACDGLEDVDCLAKLEGTVSSMASLDRLELERFMLAEKYSCSSALSDELCLKYFDNQISQLTSNERFAFLSSACASGQLVVAEPAELIATVPKEGSEAVSFIGEKVATPQAPHCNFCDGRTDESCLSTLDNMVTVMTDSKRLDFLRSAMEDAEQICAGLSSKDCLTSLDRSLRRLDDNSRLSKLVAGCALLADATDLPSASPGQVLSITDVAQISEEEETAEDQSAPGNENSSPDDIGTDADYALYKEYMSVRQLAIASMCMAAVVIGTLIVKTRLQAMRRAGYQSIPPGNEGMLELEDSNAV